MLWAAVAMCFCGFLHNSEVVVPLQTDITWCYVSVSGISWLIVLQILCVQM